MALWSRLRPRVEDSNLTTEKSRREAKRAKERSQRMAAALKSTSGAIDDLAASLTQQRETNHFTELLTDSFTQRKA